MLPSCLSQLRAFRGKLERLNSGFREMAQIRQTIELLTRIFNENGTTQVKAETFRLAKFDKDVAVPAIWGILFELLYFCDHGKIDDVCVKARSTLTKDELVVFVKHTLLQQGYTSHDFARLPGDMSWGSREALLALGWLLCRENIISRFMKQRTVSVLDEEDTSHLQQDVHVEGIDMGSVTDPAAQVQQLLWLNNKLCLSLRSLYASQCHKFTLQHKIHKATENVATSPDRSHLSVMEVYLLRHPNLLKQNITLLEQDNTRLQNLLLWQKHEGVFWKWMESVLDAKIQSLSSPAAGDDDGTNRTPADNIDPLPGLMKGMEKSRLSLQEAIFEFESVVDHLERLWQVKSEGVSEEEIEVALHAINTELSLQKASLSLPQDSAPKPIQPRFLLQRKSSHNTRPPISFTQSSKGTSSKKLLDGSEFGRLIEDGAIDIDNEVNRLQLLLDEVESDVSEKQRRLLDELQELGFADAITIPPRQPASASVSC